MQLKQRAFQTSLFIRHSKAINQFDKLQRLRKRSCYCSLLHNIIPVFFQFVHTWNDFCHIYLYIFTIISMVFIWYSCIIKLGLINRPRLPLQHRHTAPALYPDLLYHLGQDPLPVDNRSMPGGSGCQRCHPPRLSSIPAFVMPAAPT